MRVALDCRALLGAHAGVAYHARGLMAALAAAAPSDDWVCFYNAVNPLALWRLGLSAAPPFRRRIVTLMPNALLDRLWASRLGPLLPGDLLCGRVDVFHGFDHVVPPLRRGLTTVTIHDLSTVRVPHLQHPEHVARCSAERLRAACARAAWVFTVSEFSRRELVELLGADPDRITVIANAAEPALAPVEDPGRLEALRRRLGLDAPFVLAVGTREPRKNLVRLIEAFAMFERRLTPRPLLVLCGGPGWGDREIAAAIRRHGVAGRVRLIGYQPRRDLATLYSAAAVVAYVSVYEGFGMPALEALQCGAPLVVSRGTVLEEVVGDAGRYADPYNPADIAARLRELLEDPGARAQLGPAGRARARRFRWEDGAAAMLGVWRRLAGTVH